MDPFVDMERNQYANRLEILVNHYVKDVTNEANTIFSNFEKQDFNKFCVALVLLIDYLGYNRFIIQVALAYIERFSKVNTVTNNNIKRIFLASILTAIKMNDDYFISNQKYASLIGLELSDVNRLEIEFLRVLDYNIIVTEYQLLFI